MDQNLILNMNEHRIKVCVYETEKVDEFIKNKAKGTKVVGAHSLQEMVAQLKKPKRVMILVKAWPAVDSFIEKLVPLLEIGDIIINGETPSTRTRSGGSRILGTKASSSWALVCPEERRERATGRV